MAIRPGPHELDETRFILRPDCSGATKTVTPKFYEELDAEFSSFKGHVLIQRYEFDEDWGTWEVHPKGDEFVYLLSGDVDFVLWSGEGEQVVHVDTPGSYVVVPQGTWHTARPRKRTSMLFVTPGEGTLNADSPG